MVNLARGFTKQLLCSNVVVLVLVWVGRNHLESWQELEEYLVELAKVSILWSKRRRFDHTIRKVEATIFSYTK